MHANAPFFIAAMLQQITSGILHKKMPTSLLIGKSMRDVLNEVLEEDVVEDDQGNRDTDQPEKGAFHKNSF